MSEAPIGTNYGRGEKPVGDGEIRNFSRVVFWVNNAKQSAEWYCYKFGFTPFKYQGLETGNRITAHHVIRKNDCYFEFACALQPNNKEMGDFVCRHGDAVRDITFTVKNLDDVISMAKKRGAKIVQDVKTISDKDGSVKTAIVRTYGDVVHTLIENVDYKGDYMPGYGEPRHIPEPLIGDNLVDTGILRVDHCVGNQPETEMETMAEWYEKTLQFHRFWSVDDTQMHTEYSALRSVVMANWEESIKMPLNEPAKGKRKSQIQEYNEFNDGAGIQHIAIATQDIRRTIKNLNERGVQFLAPPKSYYEGLRIRLAKSKCKLAEPLEDIEKLSILVDFDDDGYLLQLFTKPLQDRPTFFIEIIERHNHNGFGAGNFKALFEAIEADQAARGNLTAT